MRFKFVEGKGPAAFWSDRLAFQEVLYQITSIEPVPRIDKL
jgi:hypothetical protein